MVVLSIRISTELAIYHRLRSDGWRVLWVCEGRVCLVND